MRKKKEIIFKEFQQSRKFLNLVNYDEESVQGYSYNNSPCTLKYCEEHYWISKIGKEYHLILCNADYLDADLSKLEEMLFEFIYGELKGEMK